MRKGLKMWGKSIILAGLVGIAAIAVGQDKGPPASQPASQPAEQTKCPVCGGSKAIDCPHCHGNYRNAKGVKVICEAKEGIGCGGDGTRDCFACLGRSVVACKNCGGKGYTIYEKTRAGVPRREYRCWCYTCNGTGKVRCLECGHNGLPRGQIMCPRCRGAGIYALNGGVCPYCKAGKMPCPACSGGVTPEDILKKDRTADAGLDRDEEYCSRAVEPF